MNYLLPERLDRLAREFALGTLQGPARRRFERVLGEAPAAVRAVAAWQRRFDVLAEVVPALQPRDAVWNSLRSRLPAASPQAAPARGLRQWLELWLSGRSLGGALAGVALCALLLRIEPGLIGLEPSVDKLPESYVGLLLDGAGKPALLASSRRHGHQLTVKLLQPLRFSPEQVAQLWALPKDGSAPIPIGTVPPQGSLTLPLSDESEKLFFNVTELAVSIEPAEVHTDMRAGGKPSAPFLLRGHCVKLW